MTSISKAEKSYIQVGFLSDPPRRADGRGLHEYRTISLETGVSPLANGSARLSIGKDANGGTEILAASKLEVETLSGNEYQPDEVENGRVVCTVTCSPAAYPNISGAALEDLQYDMTTFLHQVLSHRSLHPKNLSILSGKKAWLIHLDLIVLSDAGNVHDALFMAARAALWDTKIPRTKSVEYKVTKTTQGGDMDVDQDTRSGFDTRQQKSSAADFEITDYWDEGEVLDGRDRWPICVTLNMVDPIHYLDASLQEEASTIIRLLLVYSISSAPQSSSRPVVQGMRTLGSGEFTMDQLTSLVKDGEKYAREIFSALNTKLKEEDYRRNQKARDRFSANR